MYWLSGSARWCADVAMWTWIVLSFSVIMVLACLVHAGSALKVVLEDGGGVDDFFVEMQHFSDSVHSYVEGSLLLVVEG